ncbi:MAG: ATP-binding protein, partial [Spirochaetota bacterium]
GRIGVWEYRRADAVVLVDHGVHDVLGAGDGETSQRLPDFLAAFERDDREALRGWLDDPGDPGRDFESECRVRTRDGSWRWVVVRARQRSSDLPGTVVGTLLDVTPMKEIQAALQRSRREADELSRAKSTFMARMSHEFRTPLNAILGYVQMLRGESGASTGLDRIEQSSLHLLSMVENMLDQNRVESGTLHLRPQSVPLRDLLHTVSEVGALLAGPKGLDFAVVEEGPLPERVMIDGTRLRQVLYNLVSNAVTYTDGGAVTVRVRWRDRRLRFAVIDTGRGIAPEERGRVFLPFARSHGEEGSGSGLGLAISQELVQAMGSRIWMASVVGAGSTFWFSLDTPAVDAAAIAGDSPSSAPPVHPGAPAPRVAFEERLPATVVSELRAHARIGDLEAVRAWAEERAREGAAGDLTLELRSLAAGFRVRAIRSLLESLGSDA